MKGKSLTIICLTIMAVAACALGLARAELAALAASSKNEVNIGGVETGKGGKGGGAVGPGAGSGNNRPIHDPIDDPFWDAGTTHSGSGGGDPGDGPCR